MADIFHQWNSDLVIGPSGDLLAVDGSQEVQQRVLRRLMTNLGDYIWQLSYGAGLPEFVGQIANAARISAVVRQQMALESGVQQSPEPVVNVSAGTDGTVFLSIQYVDAISGGTQVLAFPVSR